MMLVRSFYRINCYKVNKFNNVINIANTYFKRYVIIYTVFGYVYRIIYLLFYVIKIDN